MTIRGLHPFLALALGFIASFAFAGGSPPVDPGLALAEKLLAAMGGREAWSRVTFVHVEALHDDLDRSEPFVNRIWNDFSEPRVRFWAGNDQFTSGRKSQGERVCAKRGRRRGRP